MEILDKEFIGLYNYHRETKGNDNWNSTFTFKSISKNEFSKKIYFIALDSWFLFVISSMKYDIFFDSRI